jgi:hypothetical protein
VTMPDEAVAGQDNMPPADPDLQARLDALEAENAALRAQQASPPEPVLPEPPAEPPVPELPGEPAPEPVTVLPAAMEQHQPDEAAQPLPAASATNETLTMPGNAQTAAAKAHLVLQHFIDVAQEVQRDLARYVPGGMLTAVDGEVKNLIRSKM